MSKLLKFNLTTMKLYLLLPVENTEKAIRNHIFKDLFLWCIFVMSLFGTIYDFYNQVFLGYYESINALLDSVLNISLHFFLGVMLSYLILKRRDFLNLPEELEKLGRICEPPNIMETEKQAKLVSKVFYCYGTWTVVAYSLLPFFFINQCKEYQAQLSTSYKIPCGIALRMSYPFDTNDFPGYYISVIISVAVVFLFGTLNIGILLLQGVLVLHTIGHIRHLKNKIEQAFLSENPRKDFNHCILYHNEIIKFFKSVDTTFTEISFFHLFMGSLALSIVAFQVQKISTFYDKVRHASHFFSWVFVLFFRNYASQLLINESFDIVHALYNANWPGSDLKIQRDMILFMMRAQKPLALSRGRYGILSLEVYYATIITAYSYFTLLSSTDM